MSAQHDAVRTVMTYDDQLDDITRARIWSAIEDKLLDDVAPTPARRHWPIALAAGGAALALAAAAILLLVRSPARDVDRHVLNVPQDTRVT